MTSIEGTAGAGTDEGTMTAQDESQTAESNGVISSYTEEERPSTQTNEVGRDVHVYSTDTSSSGCDAAYISQEIQTEEPAESSHANVAVRPCAPCSGIAETWK